MSFEITPYRPPISWALFAVLLSASIARFSTINDPFTRNHESTASGPMVCAARNIVRYGLVTCHFGYLLNCDQVAPEHFTFYRHHPPLVPMIMALSSGIFGEEPWCYRLPSALCSILTSGLLLLMLTRKFDWRIGLGTAMLYTLCPFTWMFGDMPDVVGPPLVLFGLLSIECFSRWSESGARNWLYLAGASWFFAALCDWPAFYLVPIFAVHFASTHPMRTWWRVLPFVAGCGALLAALFGMLMIGGDKSVLSQIFHRINGPTDSGDIITFMGWWSLSLGYYLMQTLTIPVLICALGYGISLYKITRNGLGRLRAHDTTLMMILWGLMHVFIGFQSSYQHMWVWCVLVPGICAAASIGANEIWQLLPVDVRRSQYTPWTASILAVVLLLFFHLRAQYLNGVGLPVEPTSYTLEEYGKVIRKSVPAGQGVLTSDIGDLETKMSEPALWFYSDRQLRNGIRTVAQLDRSLGEGDYQLYEGFVQEGGPAPLWFIMPAQHHEEFKELAAALDTRYARWETNGFLIYLLSWTPADAAAHAHEQQ